LTCAVWARIKTQEVSQKGSDFYLVTGKCVFTTSPHASESCNDVVSATYGPVFMYQRSSKRHELKYVEKEGWKGGVRAARLELKSVLRLSSTRNKTDFLKELAEGSMQMYSG
jgi:hypothetical protein